MSNNDEIWTEIHSLQERIGRFESRLADLRYELERRDDDVRYDLERRIDQLNSEFQSAKDQQRW